MAEVNPPFVLQTGNTAEEFRGLLGALVSVPGVQRSTDLAVTQTGTPSMGVSVAAGAVYVAGTQSTTQGTYRCINDAAVVKTIAASDPTNARIDLVCAVVADSFYSGATNAWSLTVVTGVPSGSPAIPATPANGYVLARVAVAASASSITNANITDARNIAAPAMGPRGVLPGGYASTTTAQGGITATTDLTGMTCTVTVPTGRRIKITFYLEAYSTVTGDGISVRIQEGATILRRVDCAVVVAGSQQTYTGRVILAPTAGAHTYKLTMTRTGTGTLTTYCGAADSPTEMTVEDIGPTVP